MAKLYTKLFKTLHESERSVKTLHNPHLLAIKLGTCQITGAWCHVQSINAQQNLLASVRVGTVIDYIDSVQSMVL